MSASSNIQWLVLGSKPTLSPKSFLSLVDPRRRLIHMRGSDSLARETPRNTGLHLPRSQHGSSPTQGSNHLEPSNRSRRPPHSAELVLLGGPTGRCRLNTTSRSRHRIPSEGRLVGVCPLRLPGRPSLFGYKPGRSPPSTWGPPDKAWPSPRQAHVTPVSPVWGTLADAGTWLDVVFRAEEAGYEGGCCRVLASVILACLGGDISSRIMLVKV